MDISFLDGKPVRAGGLRQGRTSDPLLCIKYKMHFDKFLINVVLEAGTLHYGHFALDLLASRCKLWRCIASLERISCP